MGCLIIPKQINEYTAKTLVQNINAFTNILLLLMGGSSS